jgi:hypothetical protein
MINIAVPKLYFSIKFNVRLIAPHQGDPTAECEEKENAYCSF